MTTELRNRDDLDECEINGVKYVAVAVQKYPQPGYACTGCAAYQEGDEDERTLCESLPTCDRALRVDKRNIIWKEVSND